MSSSLCSQGVVLATAMAVSGTVILLAFRLQKTLLPSDQFPGDHHQIPESSQQALRSCMSSGGDGEEFRRQHGAVFRSQNPSSSSSTSAEFMKSGQKRRMPANRAALYNGILRDRGVQRLAYSLAMKVRSSVKKMCEFCQIVKRRGRIYLSLIEKKSCALLVQLRTVYVEDNNVLADILARSAETSAPQRIVPSQGMGIGLASLLPKKYEPSTIYGWRAGLSSFLFKQGN
ncbi:hypothetical protein DKX38_028595 [Salix brachista]|uniref:Ribosomal protein n=1 Tax=Salix brachista TaxID=2182728 RepID=A0A5N5J5W9_9ROSI|nr:hypothetical protein DKX38_028595 [Salix brachista]